MRRLLALVLLLAATPSSAAFPEGLRAALAELDASVARYASGAVQADPQLGVRLQTLKEQLDAYGAALPALDHRRTAAAAFSGETVALKLRASREGVVMRELGRDIGMHLASIRALEPGSSPAVGSVVLTPQQRIDRAFSVLPDLQRSGASALALLEGGARSEPFAVLRDGLNVGVPGFGAPPDQATARIIAPYRPPLAQSALAPPQEPAQAPLRRGTRDAARVTALQNELNVWRRAAGYRVIGVDGGFGPQTQEALRIFQRDNGLERTGELDGATAAALKRAADASRSDTAAFVQLGDETDAVTTAQVLLNRVAGYRLLREDGDFGGRTQRAVRAFQRANHLAPSGHVDQETLAALRREAAERPELPARGSNKPRLAPPGPVPDLYTSRRMPPAISGFIAEAEKRFGITAHLFRAVVWAEGGAIGNSSVARGPAQITRDGSYSCRALGYTWDQIRRDAQKNVNCGAYIFAHRPTEVNPPLREDASPLVVAATYNTKMKHWARISRDNKVPPFRETTAYVTRISRIYCQWTGVRLLQPNVHLYPNMVNYAKSVDQDMDDELVLEGREPRPGCSPF